jgi:hypothetical protein
MKHPYIPVDFNEMLEPDLVLLSKSDIEIDASGALVEFRERLPVQVYEDEIGINGEPERLVADGVVERKTVAIRTGHRQRNGESERT